MKSIRKFVAENGYSFPIYYDIEYDASDSYNVSSIPETLFINADGSLYNTHVGFLDKAVLENYIKKISEERR